MEKKASVLIIDDEEDLLETLAEAVESLNFYAITAQTLPTALIKINNQSFDSILLDIQLKNVSGLKVVQQIRRNFLSVNHNTPIILHSGHIAPEVLGNYKDDIDDAIVKPAQINIINEKLVYWSARKHTHQKTNLSLFIKSSQTQKKSG